RHRAAVFGTPAGDRFAVRARPPLRVVEGVIVDASPPLLIVAVEGRDELRVETTGDTTVWHGGRGGPAALRPGRSVVVRPEEAGHDQGRVRAGRIWVDIDRVTGTITACGRDTVEVDMGPHRGRTQVTIPPHAFERVLVRHPRLE